MKGTHWPNGGICAKTFSCYTYSWCLMVVLGIDNDVKFGLNVFFCGGISFGGTYLVLKANFI